MKILIVDDNERILTSLASWFENAEFEVITVTSVGEAAVALGQQFEKYDVVLSDFELGDGDGSQVLAEARQQHPEALRILMSGRSKRDTMIRTTVAVLADGGFFEKGRSPVSLLERILPLLGG